MAGSFTPPIATKVNQTFLFQHPWMEKKKKKLSARPTPYEESNFNEQQHKNKVTRTNDVGGG